MEAQRELWEIVTTLLCISKVLSAHVEAALSEFEMGMTDVKLMTLVAAYDGLSQKELSGLAGLSQAVVSTRLDRLEQAGRLKRDERGGRRVSIALTEPGLSILGKAIEAICDRGPFGTVTSASAAERQQLISAVRRLVAHMEASQGMRTGICALRSLCSMAEHVREVEVTRMLLEQALADSNYVLTEEVQALSDKLDALIERGRRLQQSLSRLSSED